MSRIGKLPITVPAGVTIDVKSMEVSVKGPKGTLSQKLQDGISVQMDGATLLVARATEQKRHKALHGLYRSLIANMIKGVTEGYKVEQELVGVGYRASNQGQLLDLVLGYSHHVVFELPGEIKVATRQDRGANPIITLESHDKQLLGQVAAKIRSLRVPEPYKGKGIKFVGETLRRKAGKSAAKK
ncbi:MAG: 50S ribosomal protein L6 [Bacteroidetes bacterium]|nr:50S ribosomal protein L6 [Bacteroidota bacterium]MBK7390882.1 50S ribosomal protein L6 [Bacteroidota bacterium]MBK7969645.1 50S ribosomal protein L6 [Bacteroidota bacterium]MBK8416099.1 50S ribosomal protein L6 [Bacteroidota bacterium]MBK9045738.1 50S ribosomal protein L6 [Bacteroidota bacterium]